MKLKTKVKLYNIGFKGAAKGLDFYNQQKKRNFVKDLVTVSLYALPMVLVGMATEYMVLKDGQEA